MQLALSDFELFQNQQLTSKNLHAAHNDDDDDDDDDDANDANDANDDDDEDVHSSKVSFLALGG